MFDRFLSTLRRRFAAIGLLALALVVLALGPAPWLGVPGFVAATVIVAMLAYAFPTVTLGGLAAAGLIGMVALLPGVAFAGPIEDLITAIFPQAEGAAWLAQLGATVVAVAAFLAAVLPQGTNGVLRRILDWLALNVGNAENKEK